MQEQERQVNDQGCRPPDGAFADPLFPNILTAAMSARKPPCNRCSGRRTGLFRQCFCPQSQGKPLHDRRRPAADNLESLFWPRGCGAGTDFAARGYECFVCSYDFDRDQELGKLDFLARYHVDGLFMSRSMRAPKRFAPASVQSLSC